MGWSLTNVVQPLGVHLMGGLMIGSANGAVTVGNHGGGHGWDSSLWEIHDGRMGHYQTA